MSFSRNPTKLNRDWYRSLLEIQDGDLHQRMKLKIAIVGAGISGLTSAWLLGRAGHEVDVFEANNIPGGRIKTLRHPFTDDLYAEAGAMRIPSSHVLTLGLLSELGFTKIPDDKKDGLNIVKFQEPDSNKDPDIVEFQKGSDANFMFFNSVLRTQGEYDAGNRHVGFHNLKSIERSRKAKELFELCVFNYVDQIKDLGGWRQLIPNTKNIMLGPCELFTIIGNDSTDDHKNWNNMLMTAMDAFSFRQFLSDIAWTEKKFNGDKEKLSGAAASFISSVLVYDMHYPSSMAAILGDYKELNDDKYYQIDKGMDKFPIELAKLAKETKKGRVSIEYNTRVRSIEVIGEDNDKIMLTVENPISRFQRSRPRFQGPLQGYDIVIMSVPFSAMRHIDMNKLLSENKKSAVRRLHYDNSCKILLEFRKKFWEDAPYLIRNGGSTITDLPLRQVHYPSANQYKKENGLLLASYTWGEDSLRWTSLRPDDRVRFALDNLEALHWRQGSEKDYLKEICSGGFSHSWADQEFTSGAFAMFEPTQLTDLFVWTWNNEGRVHYCGEHTSTKHGWIEGAVESGLRVSKEILTRANRMDGFSKIHTRPPG